MVALAFPVQITVVYMHILNSLKVLSSCKPRQFIKNHQRFMGVSVPIIIALMMETEMVPDPFSLLTNCHV
jgi:hypothetical protein